MPVALHFFLDGLEEKLFSWLFLASRGYLPWLVALFLIFKASNDCWSPFHTAISLGLLLQLSLPRLKILVITLDPPA